MSSPGSVIQGRVSGIRHRGRPQRVMLLATDGAFAVVLSLVLYKLFVHPEVPWREFLDVFWLRSVLYAAVWLSILFLHGAYRPRADWRGAVELWAVVRSTLWLSLLGIPALALMADGSSWEMLPLFLLQGLLGVAVRAIPRAGELRDLVRRIVLGVAVRATPRAGELRNLVRRIVPRWVLGVVVATVSLVIASALWDHVSLPYQNPHGIVGVLSDAVFNPTTNTLRFLLFVTLPSAAWLVVMRGRSGGAVGDSGSRSMDVEASPWHRFAVVVIAIMGLLVALGSLVQGLDNGLENVRLDFFHEGDALAPTSNWVADGQLWAGNAITRGAGHDVITTWLGWQLFGHDSIGAYKALHHLLSSAVPLSLWFFALVLQFAVARYAAYLQRALLLALTLSLLYLAHGDIVYFQIRSVPIVLSLAALVLGFSSGRAAWYALAGVIGVIALLFSSESGTYVLGASAVTIAAFSINPAWRAHLRHEVLPWLGGVLVAGLALLLVFGWAEMQAWIEQVVSTATRWDYVYAYVYATPDLTSPLDRHTWPIVLLALLVLGFTILLPAYCRDASLRTQGQVHLVLVAVAVISYRTALGRSDLPHFLAGAAFATFAGAFTMWLVLRRVSPRPLRAVVLPLSVVPLAVGALTLTLGPILTEGASVWPRLEAYAEEPDDRFLSSEQARARLRLVDAMEKPGCLFVFPNEPAWYYLLDRRTCGPYFFTIHIMGTDLEAETLDILASNPPPYVLYDGPADVDVDSISNQARLPRLHDWILAEYVPYVSVDGWVLLEHRG